MLIQPENQRRELGKPVVFTCLVSGYPVPRVEWRKEKSSISSTKDGRIKRSFGKTNATVIQSVLNITAVTRNDNGTYFCESSNVVENLKETTELLVLGMIFWVIYYLNLDLKSIRTSDHFYTWRGKSNLKKLTNIL